MTPARTPFRIPLRRTGLALLGVLLVTAPGGAVTAQPPVGPGPAGPTVSSRADAWTVRTLPLPQGFSSAQAAAVSGDVVVGTAYDDQLASRAVAWDLAAGTVRALGPQGCDSGATAIDGDTVVGWCETETGQPQAFAVDLGQPGSTALGTLPGGWSSEATGVDGLLVAGTGNGEVAGEFYAEHPFVHDLGSGETTPVPLHAGGSMGEATGIDGTLVVGWSDRGDGNAIGFAHDLGTGTRSALEPLAGGDASWAYDVDGDTVVGASLTSAGSEAFIADLSEETLHGLGTLELGTHSAAYGVDGGLVVGRANVYYDQDSFHWHAFAWTVATGMVRLPDLQADRSSEASDVDGGRVVGTASTSAGDRAVVWTRQSSVSGPRPVIKGDPMVGARLTVQRGSWTPAGVRLTQRWLRDGKPISGATGTTYRVVKADRGHRLRVAVTGRKTGWAPTTMTSAPTAKVR